MTEREKEPTAKLDESSNLSRATTYYLNFSVILPLYFRRPETSDVAALLFSSTLVDLELLYFDAAWVAYSSWLVAQCHFTRMEK
jgi:hypothetical protein